MDMLDAKKQYNSLLKCGELKDILPGAKGKWDEDKRLFLRYCEENERILNDDFLDLDVEEEDIFNEYE